MKLKRTLVKIVRRSSLDEEREPFPTPTSLKRFDDENAKVIGTSPIKLIVKVEDPEEYGSGSERKTKVADVDQAEPETPKEEDPDKENKDPKVEDPTSEGHSESEENDSIASFNQYPPIAQSAQLNDSLLLSQSFHSALEASSIASESSCLFSEFLRRIDDSRDSTEDENEEGEIHEEFLDTLGDEEISLQEALSESPHLFTENCFVYAPPAWVDYDESDPYQASHENPLSSSGLDTTTLEEIPERLNHRRTIHIDEYETTLSSSEESTDFQIPYSILLLQRFGQLLATFDNVRRAMMSLPVAKYLAARLQKLHLMERLAELGAALKQPVMNIKGPLKVLVKLLAITQGSMNQLIAKFLATDKPYLGLKGVKGTVSKRRLRSPASVIFGTAMNGVLKSMNSRARMLRERAK